MKLKFGERRVLNSSFCVAILILLAGENGLIKFDLAGSDLTLLLGNKNMKIWNFTINTRNDTAKLSVNYVVRELEFYTSDSGHYCSDIHSNFHQKPHVYYFQSSTI